ncbi:MAG: hypothetical protein GF309_08880 [Candidatus Lokiarchaeota archaeon]|nr:hypothetical protein [Candidatus Lokiarchaeota archaeon]
MKETKPLGPLVRQELYEKAESMDRIEEFSPPPYIEPFGEKTIPKMQLMNERLRALLMHLLSEEIPGKNMSSEQLRHFCKSMVEETRRDLDAFTGSWAVLPIDFEGHRPSDAGVEFVYLPTYLGVCILTWIKNKNQAIAESVSNYDRRLKKGYSFSAKKEGLRGHGYHRYATQLETIKLFSQTGVLKFISDNPEYSTEMYDLLKKIKRNSEKKLERNNFVEGWGKLSREGCKIRLEYLKDF